MINNSIKEYNQIQSADEVMYVTSRNITDLTAKLFQARARANVWYARRNTVESVVGGYEGYEVY